MQKYSISSRNFKYANMEDTMEWGLGSWRKQEKYVRALNAMPRNLDFIGLTLEREVCREAT